MLPQYYELYGGGRTTGATVEDYVAFIRSFYKL
jgi:hypothetical protein